MTPLLEACLNGERTADEHPAIPRTPKELATDSRVAVDAGAAVLHLHPYDEAGRQSLAPDPCAAALEAVRAACPGTPISLSTSAAIEPDPDVRLKLVAAWEVLPDLVTANQGEPGIVELSEHLLAREVGIEAGLLSADDARLFVAAGIADRCTRVLLEPLDAEPETAVAHAAEMESIVTEAGIELEQVHHGDGLATWAVMRRGLALGHGTRAGLEDATVLPDGSQPAGNAELVRTAAELIAQFAQDSP